MYLLQKRKKDYYDLLKEKYELIKINLLIYNKLLINYNNKKYEKMKQYIYDIFLNKLDDIDNIKN